MPYKSFPIRFTWIILPLGAPFLLKDFPSDSTATPYMKQMGKKISRKVRKLHDSIRGNSYTLLPKYFFCEFLFGRKLTKWFFCNFLTRTRDTFHHCQLVTKNPFEIMWRKLSDWDCWWGVVEEMENNSFVMAVVFDKLSRASLAISSRAEWHGSPTSSRIYLLSPRIKVLGTILSKMPGNVTISVRFLLQHPTYNFTPT